MGNGDAKKLICMIHGHELGGEVNADGAGKGQRGIKGKKTGQL